MYIKDSEGNVVIDFKKDTVYLWDVDYDSSTIYSGMHTVYWDLEHKAPKLQKDFVSMYYSARSGYGPEAIPGDYSVELVMPNKKLVSSLNVKIDPRWNIPKSDLEKQFNTANEVISMIEESQEKLNEMRSITNQIINLINLTKNNEAYLMIKKYGNEIVGKISNVENSLYQNKIETSQDEINYARKWTNHITHLYDRITTDNQAPNDGMIKRVKELKDNYKKIMEPYNDIINNDLKRFKEYLEENNIERIIID